MRKPLFMLVLVLIAALVAVGCGGSDGAASEEAPDTAATTAPAAETSPADSWTTVTTLHSDDPKNAQGILVSEPFTVTGDVQVVLDLPNGKKADGVLATIIPADMEIDVDAVTEGEDATVLVAIPTKVISGLDGEYVLVVSVPTEKAWSIDIQTQP